MACRWTDRSPERSDLTRLSNSTAAVGLPGPSRMWEASECSLAMSRNNAQFGQLHILANLLPPDDSESPRILKRAISQYQARGPAVDRTNYKATLTMDILIGAPP
jgi:hypothetical protein